eukprot:4648508-Pyramimonas_sp.AAC.1
MEASPTRLATHVLTSFPSWVGWLLKLQNGFLGNPDPPRGRLFIVTAFLTPPKGPARASRRPTTTNKHPLGSL